MPVDGGSPTYERMLRDVLEALGRATGPDFLDRLLAALARALGADTAFVGRIDPRGQTVETIALWDGTPNPAPLRYTLAGTPCAGIVSQDVAVFETGVAALFPQDGLLGALEIEAFGGAPLFDRAGHVLGVLVVLSRRPFAAPALVGPILSVFGARAAAEMESAETQGRLANVNRALRVALDARAASEARLQDFARASSDWFWEQDAALRFTYVSEGLRTVTGSDPAAIVGKTREQLREEGLFERSDSSWTALARTVAAREAFRDFDYAQRGPNGRLLHLRISGLPIVDETGRFCGYRGTGRDVTALYEARAEAALNERRLRDAIESLPVGFLMLDGQARFVLCNRRYRELYPGAAGTLEPGRPFADIATAAMPTEPPEVIGYVLDRQREATGEPCHYTTTGGRHLMITHTRSADGSTLGVHVDITDMVALQHQLAEATRRAEEALAVRTRFLANMSHELRTPLNAVIGFSELMLMETQGPLDARYLEFARIVKQSGEFLLSLIVDILDVARIEAGKMSVGREPVALATAVREAAAMLSLQAERKGLALTLELPPGETVVPGDARRLKQVVQNLLSNAVKFTAAGSVTVRLAREGDRVRLTVADTGRGMTAEDIAFAMEPFQQRRGMDSREVMEGTGLGLPLVKALVELHGGRFGLVSEPGRGTEATVWLPAVAEGAAAV